MSNKVAIETIANALLISLKTMVPNRLVISIILFLAILLPAANASHDSHDDYAESWAPDGVLIEGVGGFSHVFCINNSLTGDFDCNPNSPRTIHLEGTKFDVSSWNYDILFYAREVYVEVEYVPDSGVSGSGIFDGFVVAVGTDRDDTGTAGNVDPYDDDGDGRDYDDQFYMDASDDQWRAEVFACIVRDTWSTTFNGMGPADSLWDDIIVSIFAWASENVTGETGSSTELRTTSGVFDIYVTYGAYVDNCDYNWSDDAPPFFEVPNPPPPRPPMEH